jgi:hypothetical protein
MSDYGFKVDGAMLIREINMIDNGKASTRLDKHLSGWCTLLLPLASVYDQAIFGWRGGEYVPGGRYNVYVSRGSCGSRHRVHVHCKCGRMIPYGRLHQHAPACPRLTDVIHSHNPPNECANCSGFGCADCRGKGIN